MNAQELADFLARHRLSQRAAARLSGVPAPLINMILTGKRVGTEATWFKLLTGVEKLGAKAARQQIAGMKIAAASADLGLMPVLQVREDRVKYGPQTAAIQHFGEKKLNDYLAEIAKKQPEILAGLDWKSQPAAVKRAIVAAYFAA